MGARRAQHRLPSVVEGAEDHSDAAAEGLPAPDRRCRLAAERLSANVDDARPARRGCPSVAQIFLHLFCQQSQQRVPLLRPGRASETVRAGAQQVVLVIVPGAGFLRRRRLHGRLPGDASEDKPDWSIRARRGPREAGACSPSNTDGADTASPGSVVKIISLPARFQDQGILAAAMER